MTADSESDREAMRVAAQTPVAVLEFLRRYSNEESDNHVRLFQSMPLRDRLEFLFRATTLLSAQGKESAHLIDILFQLSRGTPSKRPQ